MNETDILSKLSEILEKVLKEPVSIDIDSDLIGQEILDSLDGMVFMLEVEEVFGKHFPDDLDLVAEGYYQMRKLVDFLQG
jgi:acyl carrier protein